MKANEQKAVGHTAGESDKRPCGFTPGEWDVTPLVSDDHDRDPVGVYEIRNVRHEMEQRLDISTQFKAGSIEEENYLDDLYSENQANARLIACAPAMLEALELAEKAMASLLSAAVLAPRQVKENPPYAAGIELTDNALANARAIIVRAKGEA